MEYGEGGGLDGMRLSRRSILRGRLYPPLAALGQQNKPPAFDTVGGNITTCGWSSFFSDSIPILED